VTTRTAVIWFGPALVLLAGALAVVVIVRRRSRAASEPTESIDKGEDW
jgi:cytochrome c-type biogenesis protein CcmH